ncbi:class I SAM-dependent methyltransferase [Candidatus Micrarchaeota archaeon]|nr:class I SAM-dependent methyltransferase [Candidatus Micrarchaeota archaeon]MBU1930212.1 class I SAM-dependent methyltransferase [Candidatus Micrarchaeota archaeon]
MDRKSFVLENLNGRILDVGFVACSLHESVKKKFSEKNLFGVDTKPVPKKPNYKRASAEQLPFDTAFFDSILAGELIEHLHKPEKFVQEANRVLKKKGILIITTPNRQSLINRLTHAYHAPLHFSLYSIPELIGLVKRNGFVVEKLFCLPYTPESSPGSRYKWFYTIRKVIHPFLPVRLQEEIILKVRKEKVIA